MSRKNHKNVGVQNGLLNRCPNLINCVCSQYSHPQKYFQAPWRYKAEQVVVMDTLINVLSGESQLCFIESSDNYVHFEATVPFFGFIDDVEFYVPEGQGEIHFRSASRIGSWDLGLNKLRLKMIKKKLKKSGLELF